MQGRYSIFASLGNARQPFNRFLQMVDEAAERAGMRTLLQTGHSTYRPKAADAVDFVTRPEFEELVRAADSVIMHAGVGSVMTALQLGKIPIVVPRRLDHGEHIDNHQFQLAAELSRLGWCRVANGTDELLDALRTPPDAASRNGNMSNQLMRNLVSDFIR